MDMSILSWPSVSIGEHWTAIKVSFTILCWHHMTGWPNSTNIEYLVNSEQRVTHLRLFCTDWSLLSTLFFLRPPYDAKQTIKRQIPKRKSYQKSKRVDESYPAAAKQSGSIPASKIMQLQISGFPSQSYKPQKLSVAMLQGPTVATGNQFNYMGLNRRWPIVCPGISLEYTLPHAPSRLNWCFMYRKNVI